MKQLISFQIIAERISNSLNTATKDGLFNDDVYKKGIDIVSS